MKRKLLALISAFVVLPVPIVAQTNSGPTSNNSGATNEPPIANFKKMVVYLTTTCKDGTSFTGTAFFVSVPSSTIPNISFPYLVTNRHVAEARKEDGSICPAVRYVLKSNAKSSTGADAIRELPLPISLGPDLHWYYPDDAAIDLAVYPISLNQRFFDFDTLSLTMFETSDKFLGDRVAEGTPVLFAGYFYQFPGVVKLQPIVRQGIVAMLPNERMMTTLHGLAKLYLADLHVFNGNSGAPAVVNIAGVDSAFIHFSGFPYRLVGVVSGFLEESSSGELTAAAYTNEKHKNETNSGIATIVPADDLKDLLMSTPLVDLRKRTAEEMNSTNRTNP